MWALIKRANIFLSDGEFDEAERYCEQALRQDTENFAAYLGKLMAQLGVHNKFAHDEDKAVVQEYLDQQQSSRMKNSERMNLTL